MPTRQEKLVSLTLTKIANQKQLRKVLTKKLDNYIHKSLVENDSENLESVQRKKYEFLSAMLHSAVRNMDKGYISKNVIKKLIEVLVENSFMDSAEGYDIAVKNFKEKYNAAPSSFIVLSPTQNCNIHCKGYYAT